MTDWGVEGERGVSEVQKKYSRWEELDEKNLVLAECSSKNFPAALERLF